jgi:hypothetical protein
MYQAMKGNEGLAQKVSTFFSTQLDRYFTRTVENNQVHLNVRLCVSDDFRLVEPIDVLFHCALVCINSSAMLGIGGPLFIRLNQIVQSYLDQDAGFMFNLYRKQFSDLIASHSTPLTVIHVLYSLELGLLDACIEHLISTDNYANIDPLLTKYEITSCLMSAETEDLMAPSKTEPPYQEEEQSAKSSCASSVINTRKRKLEPTPATKSSASTSITAKRNAPLAANKKSKNLEVDKENQPPSTSSQVNTKLNTIFFSKTPKKKVKNN